LITVNVGFWAAKSPVTSEDLPLPATPVATVSTPVGIVTVTSWRLFDRARVTVKPPDGLRSHDVRGSGRVAERSVGLPGAHHFPTLIAGSRSELHHMIRRTDDRRVVFHHQDGVSPVPELIE
jgi:hypothetical protein